MIDANHLRQTGLPHQTFEGVQRVLELLIGLRAQT
jgi:hypothetical protein